MAHCARTSVTCGNALGARRFITRGKVVTSRWLAPGHGGMNLGSPTQS